MSDPSPNRDACMAGLDHWVEAIRAGQRAARLRAADGAAGDGVLARVRAELSTW